jgi:transposase
LIVRRPERLDAAEQAELDHRCADCPELATTRRLAQAFAALVRERPGEAVFRAWLAEASSSGIPGVVSFAAGLRHDDAAVVAGLTLPWSSSAVEGHNTRIKLIKRQMYGRGRFDLLRRRVLLTG